MRRRLTFFVFTTVIAMVAAFLVRSALKGKEAKIEALRQSNVPILVAAKSLSAGDTLDAASVTLESWPRDHLPAGALTSSNAALGKVVKNAFGANQPIPASALLAPDQAGGVLPLLIPAGMRAMSIPVDDVSDMAGLVLPHSRVDVLVAVTTGSGDVASQRSKIVLQNIEVVAVAQSLESAPDQPRTAKVVTLLVTPQQAEQLAAMIRFGSVHVAMRNYEDSKQLATSGADVARLLGVSTSPSLPNSATQSASPDHGREPRAVRVRLASERGARQAVEVIRNGKEHQMINFHGDRALRDGAVGPSSSPAIASDPTGPAPDSDAQ